MKKGKPYMHISGQLEVSSSCEYFVIIITQISVMERQ